MTLHQTPDDFYDRIREILAHFSQLLTEEEKGYALRSLFPSSAELSRPNPNWQPGRLNPNLSWTHYRALIRVDDLNARVFGNPSASRVLNLE